MQIIGLVHGILRTTLTQQTWSPRKEGETVNDAYGCTHKEGGMTILTVKGRLHRRRQNRQTEASERIGRSSEIRNYIRN